MNDIVDSEGNLPEYIEGDKVFVWPLKQEAVVIRQILHYDSGESFWGNVEIEMPDKTRYICNCWQVKKLL